MGLVQWRQNIKPKNEREKEVAELGKKRSKARRQENERKRSRGGMRDVDMGNDEQTWIK